MRRHLLIPLLLLPLGCDDTEFSNGHGGGELTGAEGWEGVAEAFAAECVACHGPGGAAGLDLETDPCGAVVDIDSPTYGAKIVAPGDHQASVLWHKMADTSTYGGVMPIVGAMDAAVVDNVAAWIDDGAPCE